MHKNKRLSRSRSVYTENRTFRYKYMLSKLYATLDKYEESFSELRSLKEDVKRILSGRVSAVGPLQKIQEVELLLERNSSISYVIRHIHHNFCTEAVLFKSDAYLNDSPFYIQIP